jgi:undecaprenyl-phosphate 4-deoxy-4-formamido-L-arabinose transferase
MRMESTRISVIVPVYNSADCLDALVGSLQATLESAGGGFQVILVDDASSDGSWARIQALARQHREVLGLRFRRNFGQDNAIMAGLRRAEGRTVVIMDDDLQHDPADVPRLVERVEAGFDVCFADFGAKQQLWWKNLGSWINDLAARVVLRKPRHLYLSPFKAISADVVREIQRHDGPFPYVDGLLFLVTRHMTQIEAVHHRRHAGRGNYDLVRFGAVWLKLVTGFSGLPLRLAAYLGFAFAVVGGLMAIGVLVTKILRPEAPTGWASILVAIVVLGGIQLACLGMIGEYLGRVFLHLNRRPQYVVKEDTAPCGETDSEEVRGVRPQLRL